MTSLLFLVLYSLTSFRYSSSEQVVMTCCCQPKETLQLSKGTPKGFPLTQMDDPAATQRHVILASLILESEQLFGFVPVMHMLGL